MGEGQRRATQTLALATQRGSSLLATALAHLTLGRASCCRCISRTAARLSPTPPPTCSRPYDGLRQAGTQHHVPRALLARAELHRVQGDFAQARRDLDEAMTIATRGEMGLHQADGHLAYARLHLAMGDTTRAQESLATARALVARMGYHRRDPEVQELEERLKRS